MFFFHFLDFFHSLPCQYNTKDQILFDTKEIHERKKSVYQSVNIHKLLQPTPFSRVRKEPRARRPTQRRPLCAPDGRTITHAMKARRAAAANKILTVTDRPYRPIRTIGKLNTVKGYEERNGRREGDGGIRRGEGDEGGRGGVKEGERETREGEKGKNCRVRSPPSPSPRLLNPNKCVYAD